MSKRIRALVVRSDEIERSLVESAFSAEAGLEMVDFSDGLSDEWQPLLAQPCDVVVVACAEYTGRMSEMLEYAVKLRPDDPVVVLTRSPDSVFRPALEAGADDVLELPQAPEEFRFALELAAARRKGADWSSVPTRPIGFVGGGLPVYAEILAERLPDETRGQPVRAGDSTELLCSFCGKSQRQVKKLIAGPGVYICNECIDLCNEIIAEELTASPDLDLAARPRDIYTDLNDYVVSQEEAKRTLSVAVCNHYKRIQVETGTAEDGVAVEKANVLLLGPSGCGKTLLAETLQPIVKVPFAIVDATALTAAGYAGDDVESILLKLIQAADFNIKKAETGIIYIDNVDQIARERAGEGVLQALLPILEGTDASVPPQGGREHPHQKFLSIDTTNILFICGGAFEGLDSTIRRRIENSVAEERSEQAVEPDLLAEMMPEDLLNFGLTSQFLGCFPVVSVVPQLRREDLVRILIEPKNALVKQYQRFFDRDGIEFVIAEDALGEIADKALTQKTGARGLRSIIEDALRDVMFELPWSGEVTRCVITKECIAQGARPTLSTSASDPGGGDGHV